MAFLSLLVADNMYMYLNPLTPLQANGVDDKGKPARNICLPLLGKLFECSKHHLGEKAAKVSLTGNVEPNRLTPDLSDLSW